LAFFSSFFSLAAGFFFALPAAFFFPLPAAFFFALPAAFFSSFLSFFSSSFFLGLALPFPLPLPAAPPYVASPTLLGLEVYKPPSANEAPKSALSSSSSSMVCR